MLTTIALVTVAAMVLLAWAWTSKSTPTGDVRNARRKPDFEGTDQYPIAVAGEASYQAALISICGPYASESQRQQHTATLIREPANPHDSNAIRVEIRGQLVGYVPRDQAAKWAPRMDQLPPDARSAPVNALVRGGWRTSATDTGLYGVRIDRPNLPRTPRAKKLRQAVSPDRSTHSPP